MTAPALREGAALTDVLLMPWVNWLFQGNAGQLRAGGPGTAFLGSFTEQGITDMPFFITG